MTPANEHDRFQVEDLARQVQQAIDQLVEVAFVDQGCIDDEPAQTAQQEGTKL